MQGLGHPKFQMPIVHKAIRMFPLLDSQTVAMLQVGSRKIIY